MGISASQARLLTITARLTSNEYESQQISNAKMRLANQSEQVSREYIAALDARRLQYMTYNAKGEAVTTDLTANVMYQYADMKNQYALANTSGQVLVLGTDAKNFEKADNLDEFLASYGIEKVYKTQTLAENAQKMAEYSQYYEAWENAVNEVKMTPGSDIIYQTEKANANNRYFTALADYQDAVLKQSAGVAGIDVSGKLDILAEAKRDFTDTMTFTNWAIAKAKDNNPEIYENVTQYYDVMESFLTEAEDIGCTSIEDTYGYSDTSKAQWYTNLWYRMNGESSEKSSEGKKHTNYDILDSKLASSSEWIQDALTQGMVSLEVVSNVGSSTTLETELISEKFNTKDAMKNLLGNPLVLSLKGIQWRTTEYSNCVDFTEKDDEVAIARAEAEYERKNNEISAKDKKYENRIKTLDTEHNALQTEYESVQSAMNKNIDRSFKAFS